MGYNDSIHECLISVIIVAQCFGIMPIKKIGKDASQMKFVWLSWKVGYTLCVMTGIGFCSVMSIYKTIDTGVALYTLVIPMFYIFNFIAMCVFLNMATKWPRMIRHWAVVDKNMHDRYRQRTNVRLKINVVMAIYLLLSTAEHSLAIINFIYSRCKRNADIDSYFRKQFSFVFDYYEYSRVYGTFLLIINILSTFVWNYIDLFIIILSSALAPEFARINDRLLIEEHATVVSRRITNLDYVHPKRNVRFWREIREDYDALCCLCRHLDCVLSDLILVSFANNLSFILTQLFNSLKEIQTVIEGLYFFSSFGFLICRAVLVSIYASWINEESKKPAPFLNSLPSEVYNKEIHRLLLQINFDSVALSGHRFFYLKRGFILNVAAAIVTYELVLIQFNQTSLKKLVLSSNETVCY